MPSVQSILLFYCKILTPSTRTKATITATDTEPAPRMPRTKKSADSEENIQLPEATKRNLVEAPPVPSPRASKRTNGSRYQYFFHLDSF